MAELSTTFDATQVEPRTSPEPLPSGKYGAQIVASEMRVTKSGNGQYLWLELEIIDGEYQGRKVWDRLNLINDNETARTIAEQTLSSICRASVQIRPPISCSS